MDKLISLLDFKNRLLINGLIREELDLISTVKDSYPGIKIDLSKEELIIINEVIFDRLLIKDKIENYKECMILYISNLMYDAVFYGDKVDLKLLRKRTIYLNKYLNCFDIAFIMYRINKRMEEETSCKIIKFSKKKIR